MTRGRPALWSSVLGLPFVAVAGYIGLLQDEYPLLANQPTAPTGAGVVLGAFGLFVVGLGVYVQLAPTPGVPRMREGEWVVDDRNPAQRSALARAFVSVPFLATGLHLLYFTEHPLVYPAVTLSVGLYLFSTGLYEYWRNTLTSYVLTNRRMIEEYRFISLSRTEVPLEKVRAVEERRSAWESLFGLGNVLVRAGATGGMTVAIRSVYDSTEFADVVRDHLGGVDGDPADSPVGADGDASKRERGDEEESESENEGRPGSVDDDPFVTVDAEGTDEHLSSIRTKSVEPRSDGGTTDVAGTEDPTSD